MRDRDYRVQVWGKSYIVWVSRLPKTVWEAVGEYMGQSLRVEDKTATTVLKRWREAATCKGKA